VGNPNTPQNAKNTKINENNKIKPNDPSLKYVCQDVIAQTHNNNI